MDNIKRILVIGPTGAGKSTFSKMLSIKSGFSLYHLDDFYWLKNWRRVDHDEWLITLHALCNQPSWIIDGNHLKTFKNRLINADMVIMLDYSPILCLWRYFKRSVKRYFKINDHLPRHIHEDIDYSPKFTIKWHLIKLILCYRFLTKPYFMDILYETSCQFIIFRNDREANDFLSKMYLENIED